MAPVLQMHEKNGNYGSLPTKMLAAGTAGCLADLMTFPLDTAKVRLQVTKATLLVKNRKSPTTANLF